ncbi:penicillin-binding protein 2 [Methylophilus sp. 14]|uniref:peptidoglycan D,D-transpeptidase FtsI family protein n=1 Tax=Methylophilus sp. 14 TaxID=2781019 RepID=UPI00188FC470|nr:penicillin-binding protein 2 [Methylophilus sp. 14]MBF4987879.1 penicillin-binding protein 2 [Methylophilus sp. 14]
MVMLLKESQHKLVKLPAWRRRTLLVLLLLSFVLLLGRGFYLQTLHKDYLIKKGEAFSRRKVVLMPHRGKIYDRNFKPLAISLPVESVWANPTDVQVTAAQLKQMSKLLEMPAKELQQKLQKKKKEFVYIKRRVAPDVAKQVMAMKVPGVFSQKEYKRFYPAAEVTAHIVGFTGVDDTGVEGMELYRNNVLSGSAGKRDFVRDRKGHVVEDLVAVKLPHDGQDLVLSIDRTVQYVVHRELSRAVEKHKAKAAAAVVLDAKTGEVLALVNIPTYNPNNPVNVASKLRNSAIVNIFEPGSTMKPVTAAAAMEFGPYQPDTKIQTAPGYLRIGTATIHDAHPNQVLTVSQVIQKSSNVGSAKMALDLNREQLWNTYVQLGFGSATKIGFPGEASGKVRDYKTWRPIEQATMSYGHGISVTLLQLARAYTVFANEGELLPVTLTKLSEPPVGRQVFSAKVANSVKDMLELVVQPGGTALKAQVTGYRVAGKTGTAHKLGDHGYEHDKYVGSFVGMVPASNPRLIMAVMIDEPSNGEYYGGSVAAPVFSAVMNDVLRMLVIPQDGNALPVAAPADAAEVKEAM